MQALTEKVTEPRRDLYHFLEAGQSVFSYFLLLDNAFSEVLR